MSDIKNESLIFLLTDQFPETKNFRLWRLVEEIVTQNNRCTWKICPVDVFVERNKGAILLQQAFGLPMYKGKDELDKEIMISFDEDQRILVKNSGILVFWIIPSEYRYFPQEIKDSTLGSMLSLWYDKRSALKQQSEMMNEQINAGMEMNRIENSSMSVATETISNLIENQQKPFKDNNPKRLVPRNNPPRNEFEEG